MSSIRNSISLTDRMTPTLRAILRSMDSMMVVMKNLDKAANSGVQSKSYKRAESAIQNANNKLIQMTNYSMLAKNSAEDVGDAWEGVNRKVAKSASGFSGMFSTVASGIYTIKAVANSISSVTGMADSAISDMAKLSLFNTSSGSKSKANNESIRSSDRVYDQSYDVSTDINDKVYDRVYDTSTHDKVYDTSTHDKVYDTPTHDKVYDTPTHDKVYDTSTHDKVYDTPTHDKVYDTPTHDKVYDTSTRINDRVYDQSYDTSSYNNEQLNKQQLYAQVYKTAQGSRAGLSDTAALAQRIMISDVYKGEGAMRSSIDLAGTINKALALGGGTSEENSRAVLQLSQSLSSGYLQGDELRSLREQAPYLAKMLAEGLANVDDKFIGTTIGDLKELGAQGELTSAVVVKALQSMGAQIDESFETSAPKTFSGALQSISNTVQFFMSVLSSAEGPIGRFNQALWNLADWLSTPQGFEAMSAILPIVNTAVIAFQGLAWAIQFVGNNMYWIAPILGTVLALVVAYNAYLAISKAITTATSIATGIAAVVAYAKAKADEKAALAAAAKGSATAGSTAAMMADAAATASATAAQHGFNAALWASPITWIIAIIIIVIGLIFVVVKIINKATGSTISVIGIIVGALTTAAAFIWNLFLALLDLILGIVNYLINPWLALANFFGNVFNDPIGAIVHLFGDMADNILGVIETIAKALDKVFGSNMADTVAGWRTSIDAWVETTAKEYGNGTYEEIVGNLNLSSESLGLDRWAYGDAWDTGYDFGADLENSLSEFGSMDDVMAGIEPLETEVAGGTLDSVNEVNQDVNISDEDVKLLRDMAARDYLLQLQTVTPVAHVTFGDVRETADVGKIVEVIENMVEEQMATSLVS